MRRVHAAAVFGSTLVALVIACGTSTDSFFSGGPGDGDGGGASSGTLPGFAPVDGSTDDDPNNPKGGPIEITPKDQVVTYVTGQAAPTIPFVAKLVSTGQVVPAAFTIDRGEIGTVNFGTGLFTASGNLGGKAHITATWNGTSVRTSVTVKLKVVQNGSEDVGDAGTDGGGGAGGNGGVGGDGPGGAVSAETITTLHGASPTEDAALKLLYPYDDTVWPRGILAPLLMWRTPTNYDAVLIKIHENAFDYEGTFASNDPTLFKNHPLPQKAWKQLTSSNEGEDVTVTLVFAKGTTAYGTIQTKWKIASAPLKGIVYYNSYGTRLAKNYDSKYGRFGGATLAIRGGSTDPTLIAGKDGDAGQCRVCHSVAANGSVLITQRNTAEKRLFSTYDLRTGHETPMLPEGGDDKSDNRYAWPAVYPDGTMFLGDSSRVDGSSALPNKLYRTATGDAGVTPEEVPTNWPDKFRAAYPSFSPDGKSLAFTMYEGVTGADTKTIGVMSFDRATSTFGPIRQVFRDPRGLTSVFPSFLPTNNGVVFHLETRYNTHDYGGTRSDRDTSDAPDADQGARAELWWANVPPASDGSVDAGAFHGAVATRLDKLNGVGYLPTGDNKHDDDATLNYEPTVNPVPSGGYAWVVFTSRRLYGNVATINPFHSDPRYHDLTKTPTPKKLWVAAIDLNAAPGTDPSHPAFYLPAQELLAGNARGYWVVDPCKSDNAGCESGDECCGGFCRPNPSGALVCSDVVPACAQEFEKCTTAADCCSSGSLKCINGRCALPAPNTPK